MIEGLQPYSKYKESGLPWLGRCPSHWNLRRTKLILREIDSRTRTGKEQLLRVSQYTGVTERKADDGSDAPDTRAASLVGYKQVEPHDLVINIMLAWNGSMGVSRFKGIASPAYCVYRFRDGAFPWYFHHLFRTPLYKGRIKAASTGVVESRLRLYSDDLGRLEALLPPSDEQAAIVRFLDHANRKIDGFIRAKRKLIALLNEQKQAIIHHAVTRGLNPNAPLKPTGIPWLGDIPNHWEIRRMKYLLREIDRRSSKGSETLLRVSQYTGITPRLAEDGSGKADTRAESLVGYKVVQPSDIVINIMLAWNGSLAVSEYDGIVSPAYCVYRFNDGMHPWFFHHLLRTTTYKGRIRIASTGVIESRLRLYSDDLGRIEAIVPPLKEQQAIIDTIRIKTYGLSTAIARTEREIALMQEYRTRLTADVVTGKLDVRPAAALLPDLPADSAAEPLPNEAEEEPELEETP